MPQIEANGITIEYDTIGSESDRPLLLVMGLGAQLIHWREAFCQLLADQGHFVIRYDNRDTGHSQKFGHFGVPDMMAMAGALLEGRTPAAPYTLDDMAADGLGLLDALGIRSAHVCGASLGGMVVQTMAINAPGKVRTLTSIMSTTGNRELPPAREDAMAALLSPAAPDRAGSIERSIRNSRVMGSPGYPIAEDELRARAAQAYDRSFYPEGVARQMAAAVAHGDRRAALRQLDVPALVIHGKDDPLIPVEGGVDTHVALRNGELYLLDGMGHDIPEPLWDPIVGRISALTGRYL